LSPRKVIDNPEDLVERIEELRNDGATVVFANGCFELLHVGHARYLYAAKALGEVLIVAVNSDASMKKIKPDRNPANPDYERYELVAALEPVDFVVPLREETPERLLRLYRPDIHTKGTDYTLDQIPERSVVESYGGRVELVGDPKSHSTSEMLRQIRE
jgi:D-beta-D-heptose 7-phosphate kinase/D-beta-D-heptose 1-phosphate adenosyltransferase